MNTQTIHLTLNSAIYANPVICQQPRNDKDRYVPIIHFTNYDDPNLCPHCKQKVMSAVFPNT